MSELDLVRVRASFPHPVGLGLRRAGESELSPLLDAERAVLSPRAVEKRRLQFHLGRAAGHAALAELGVEDAPIGRGERGEPLLPRAVVGSITHSGGTAVAVVGWRRHYRGIGIDLEALEPTLLDATRRVCSPAELAWTDSSRGRPERPVHVRRLMVFSAKESVFKALYPIEQVWLGFQDAELEWSEREAGFTARLLRSAGQDFPAGATLAVRCQLSATQVFTWTWV